MIVLDAYAVIALLLGEPAAAEVAVLLQDGDDVMMTTLGLAEVVDRLVRGAHADPEEVMLDLAELGLTDPTPLTSMVSLRAGLLRSRHYHRSRCSVSLADCVAVETARVLGGTVATSDPHLLDVCHAEGVAHTALTDSTGARWRPEA